MKKSIIALCTTALLTVPAIAQAAEIDTQVETRVIYMNWFSTQLTLKDILNVQMEQPAEKKEEAKQPTKQQEAKPKVEQQAEVKEPAKQSEVEQKEEATPSPTQEQPVQKAPIEKPEAATESSQPATSHVQQEEKEVKPALSEVDQIEAAVVELTNKEREKAGLAPLQMDTALMAAAREKSQDMKDNNYFSHTSPTFGSPFDRLKALGISYQAAGENIAKGQRTAEEVVTAWMNSEGHRANILDEKFTHIGVGFVQDGSIWTQQFIKK